jgi:hypothetical protein
MTKRGAIPRTKTMTIQELFEQRYADQNNCQPEDVKLYRWFNRDGYSLPKIDRAYRYFVAGYEACIAKYARHADKAVAWEADDSAGESGKVLVTNDPAIRDEWMRDEIPVCPLFGPAVQVAS